MEKSMTVAMEQRCLSVIMPVFNEESLVLAVLDRVLARPEVKEVVIVNDASTDGTWDCLQHVSNPRVRIFHQEKNCGKGAAVIRGLAEASAPFVIIQDADFEYHPDDYEHVLAPLLEGKAEVVYGSRFMGTPGQVRYFRHEMGNKFLTFLSNVCNDVHLTDMETCYKAFRREVIQNLNLESQRFGIDVEITAKLVLARRLRIWEVPISYRPRSYDEGKKITWKDGVAAICHILRYNLFAAKSTFYRQPWEALLGPVNLAGNKPI
jgi:glycosyltransferase involved in cell wall biosynthesis